MHLTKLQLSLGTDTLGEGSVADDVAECLTFRLILLEDLALRVVANHAGIDKPAEIQPLRPEMRHCDQWIECEEVALVAVK